MINNSGIVCHTKAAAISALQVVAESLQGTQRDAIAAICCWIEENYPRDFTPETRARLQAIYDEICDEPERKALEWAAMGGQPPDGARVQVPYIFNADKKQWELECEMPPTWTPEHFLPKTDEAIGDEEES